MFSNYGKKNNRGKLRNSFFGSLCTYLTGLRESMKMREKRGFFYLSPHPTELCLSLRLWQKISKIVYMHVNPETITKVN